MAGRRGRRGVLADMDGVPLFWNAAGLPIGTNYTARVGDEATLFRLAAQLEAARPWIKRRPRLHSDA